LEGCCLLDKVFTAVILMGGFFLGYDTVWIHIPEDIIFNIRLYCAAIEGDIVIGVK
jgi:hypothetical protein